MEPQTGAVALAESGAAAGHGQVLTRKTSGEDVHGQAAREELLPVHGRDVAQVGDVGVVVGEDPGGARVGVRDERQVTAEDGLHGHVKAAIAGAEAGDGEGHRVPPVQPVPAMSTIRE